MAILDLQAEQCPHVMSLVRTALLRATADGFIGEVQIRTIEQSVPEKLKIFLASLEANVSIKSSTTCSLDKARRNMLLATEDISEQMLLKIEVEQFITLELRGKSTDR